MAADQKQARLLKGWLVFLDESGLLLLPVVRRTWSRCRQTPVLRHVGRNRKKLSAIAALCVSPDRREVPLYFQLLVNENFNSMTVLGFLRHLTRHFHDPLLLVWDRARIHRDLHTAVFVDVMHWRQFYFPPYASELNPVEYVWGYLKTNPLANLACPEVGVLAASGRRHARSLQRKPALLRSFIRHSPISLRLC
jgi:transposase